MCFMNIPPSKYNADPKLNVPLSASLGNLSELRIRHVGGGATHIELGLIENVIELCTELNVDSLADRVVFENRPVEGIPPRSSQIGLAERVRWNCEGSRRTKCARVKPFLLCGIVDYSAV